MWNKGEGIVLKFGGTSVADPERIRTGAGRVAGCVRSGLRVAVVVSAMGSTTNKLIALSDETSGGMPDRRELDQLLATGEQQSAALMAMELARQACPSVSFTGAQAGFLAEGPWGEGRILSVNPVRVEEACASGRVAVVTGFQAATVSGDTITLGRGGSDLSAIALAGALGADSCRIFTDVDGVFSADPRKVPGAARIDCLSWEECLEMTFLGAKVMQSRSIEMAERLELPLWVGSGEGEGTWIMGRTVDEVFRACAVVSDENIALLSAEGCGNGGCAVAEEFFLRGIHILAAAERGCPSFYIRRERLEEAAEICRRMSGKSPSVNPGAARVSVVGPGAGNHPEIGRAMLKVLGRLGAPAHLLTSSGLSVSCFVDEKDAQPALRALHAEFIEKKGEFQCA